VRLVLDTHVLLDALVFADPRVAALWEGVRDGRGVWCATAAMREEFDDVVRRERFAPWRPDPVALDAAWSAHARLHETPSRPAPWRCTDPDDQKFVDLAVQLGPGTVLLSRDRALLKLASRARGAGVQVLTPEAWGASFAVGAEAPAP
jgi:predicted nucleic acid-binding protein